MPLDIDWVFANDSIKELQKLLSDQPHGKREQIADEIIEFVNMMKERWSKEPQKNVS